MDNINCVFEEDYSENFRKALSNLQLEDLSEEDKAELRFFIELNRHLKELDQLFKIFRFHLLNLREQFTLTISDSLIRNKQINFEIAKDGSISNKIKQTEHEIDDKIAINALTISLISAGKTLVESIEVLITSDFSKRFKAPDGLTKEWISEIYDENFYYRCIYHMRNFAQHGHLPVSLNENKFGFDFYQILQTPHIKYNKKHQKQIEDIVAELHEKSAYPRFAYTPIIAGYSICIIQLYFDFLCKIKNTWSETTKRIRALFGRYPSNIIKSTDSSGDMLVFFFDDVMQALTLEKNFTNMVNEYWSSTKDILDIEKANYNKLVQNTLTRKI